MSDDQLSFTIVPQTLARPRDPYTSHAAAQSQTVWKVTKMRARVLLALDGDDAMTDDELIAHVTARFGRVSHSSVRTRRSELVCKGWVQSAGEGTSALGKPSLRWALTDSGTRYVLNQYGLLVQMATKGIADE